MPINPVTWVAKTGGSRFKFSLGKKLVRLPNKPRVVVYIYGPSYMGDGGRRTVV
jgi:hypothetical protein